MSGRKIIERFGKKGRENYVRVFAEKVGRHTLVRVQWREQGKPRTESWPNNRKGIDAAKAYAEATHERLTAKPATEIAPITVGDLWRKYLTAKQHKLSPRTIATSSARWKKFDAFVGHSTIASTITRDRMDEFRDAMLKMQHAPNQVALTVGIVRIVYRWGEERDLLAPSKIPGYRVEIGAAVRAKGPKMGEYTREQRAAIAAHFDPRGARTWRPYVLSTILAYTGARQRAARHLQWADVDFPHARLRWRAEFDKMHRDRYQPVPEPVMEALWVAYGWRLATGYTGFWILFGAQAASRGETRELKTWELDPKHKRAGRTRRMVSDRPWGYASYNGALHEAEAAAGIKRQKYTAAHAFRRGVAGDVKDATGSDKDAADYIGDKSVRVVRDHYLMVREERLRDMAERLAKKGGGAK